MLTIVEFPVLQSSHPVRLPPQGYLLAHGLYSTSPPTRQGSAQNSKVAPLNLTERTIWILNLFFSTVDFLIF